MRTDVLTRTTNFETTTEEKKETELPIGSISEGSTRPTHSLSKPISCWQRLTNIMNLYESTERSSEWDEGIDGSDSWDEGIEQAEPTESTRAEEAKAEEEYFRERKKRAMRLVVKSHEH